jgi:hypothetical protein
MDDFPCHSPSAGRPHEIGCKCRRALRESLPEAALQWPVRDAMRTIRRTWIDASGIRDRRSGRRRPAKQANRFHIGHHSGGSQDAHPMVGDAVRVYVYRGSRSADLAVTEPSGPQYFCFLSNCPVRGEIPGIPMGTRLRIRAMGRKISSNCPAPKRGARLRAESGYGPRAMCLGGGLQELVCRGRPSAAKFLVQIFGKGDCTVEPDSQNPANALS